MKGFISQLNEDKMLLIVGAIAFLLIIAGVVAIISQPSAIYPPQNVKARVINNKVILTWDAPNKTKVEGYVVYRSKTKGDIGEEISKTKDYKFVEEVKPGTYYYLVRSYINNKESNNFDQLKVVVSSALPRILSVSTNANYTNSRDIVVYVKAENAKYCRIKNEDNAWSSWLPYKENYSWELSTSQGKKEIYIQCKNEAGLSSIKKLELVYDNEAPSINLSYNESNGEVILYGSIIDNIDNIIECNVYADKKNANGFIGTMLSIELPWRFNVIFSKGIWVTCHDDAGNINESFIIKKNESGNENGSENETRSLVVEIENGASSVSTRSVHVQVYTNGWAEQCRLTNDEDYEDNEWSSWKPYSEDYAWHLSSGEGTKRVYVQCKGSDGYIETAYDDIIYKESSGGNNNGGGQEDNNPKLNEFKVYGYVDYCLPSQAQPEEGYGIGPHCYHTIRERIEGYTKASYTRVNIKVDSNADSSKVWSKVDGMESYNFVDYIDNEYEAEWKSSQVNGAFNFGIIPMGYLSAEYGISRLNTKSPLILRDVYVHDGYRTVYLKLKKGDKISNTSSRRIFLDGTPPEIKNFKVLEIKSSNLGRGIPNVEVYYDVYDNSFEDNRALRQLILVYCKVPSNVDPNNYWCYNARINWYMRLSHPNGSVLLSLPSGTYRFELFADDLAGYRTSAFRVLKIGQSQPYPQVKISHFKLVPSSGKESKGGAEWLNTRKVTIFFSEENATLCEIKARKGFISETLKIITNPVNGKVYNLDIILPDWQNTLFDVGVECKNNYSEDQAYTKVYYSPPSNKPQIKLVSWGFNPIPINNTSIAVGLRFKVFDPVPITYYNVTRILTIQRRVNGNWFNYQSEPPVLIKEGNDSIKEIVVIDYLPLHIAPNPVKSNYKALPSRYIATYSLYVEDSAGNSNVKNVNIGINPSLFPQLVVEKI